MKLDRPDRIIFASIALLFAIALFDADSYSQPLPAWLRMAISLVFVSVTVWLLVPKGKGGGDE